MKGKQTLSALVSTKAQGEILTNASYLQESLDSRRMGMDSFSASHCESSCQSLSPYSDVGVIVSELAFWLKPAAQLSLLARMTPKRSKQSLTEAKREGLNPSLVWENHAKCKKKTDEAAH